MDTVLKENLLEITQFRLAVDAVASHLHEGSTITIEAVNVPFWLCERNSQSDAAGMTHAANA